ncbi:hypothetical protein [Mycobacterium sp. 852013-51886_SCH5428379]|uniref:hypothetical protein n=1 Tax=Mycobacterium sp. 852013-51886_SCH5428379 TaxID=1834111 RepID=UPI0012E74BDD|nr:hypothetical protein [Mycobacterium sp. 852013-51886_SCH5428379]
MNTRVASGGVAPDRDRTDRDETAVLQDSGSQFLAGGGAGTPPVVTAGVRDGLGAAAKLLGQGIKDALSSRPLQNFLQNQGPNLPGLLDLIPKTRYTVPEDPLRRAVRESQEAEAKREQDAKGRRINEIMAKGVKLTASDGSPVYTVDGETFVKYASNGGIAYGDKYTPNPPTPRLVTIRQGPNADRSIRSILKVDPAQVRNLSGQRTPGPVPISTPFSAPIVAWKYQPPVYILVGGGTGGFGRSPF